MNFFVFSWRYVWIVMWCVKSFSSAAVGSSPFRRSHATSRNVDFSASCSIGYPRYSRIPLSPSMNVIADLHDAVFVKAGSYVIRPKSFSSDLILRRSSARTVPSSIGSSYVFPVRLSVIVIEFFPDMTSFRRKSARFARILDPRQTGATAAAGSLLRMPA